MSEQRRVSRVRDVAVVDRHVVLGGYPAWLIHRLLADLPGGLETKLARTGAPAELQDAVLDAYAALGYVGALWRREHAASTSGSPGAADNGSPVTSKRDLAHGLLGSRDVASVLGITDRRVRTLAESGRLPGRRDSGGRWCFEGGDIEAELERRSMKGAA